MVLGPTSPSGSLLTRRILANMPLAITSLLNHDLLGEVFVILRIVFSTSDIVLLPIAGVSNETVIGAARHGYSNWELWCGTDSPWREKREIEGRRGVRREEKREGGLGGLGGGAAGLREEGVPGNGGGGGGGVADDGVGASLAWPGMGGLRVWSPAMEKIGVGRGKMR
ncbi:hypothetical protein TIFTF001_020739 [Ficus carica]|uniref:Uncharacterized protein n=1 Tax=Ficus carica TaxID=3494 RepID=A0AA88ARY2_FICCA|nr:hypothetical protein TIFTF001_020739 [Ficus carica]